jgi:RNA polymerase sigma-70 factor (ECF subfamily)
MLRMKSDDREAVRRPEEFLVLRAQLGDRAGFDELFRSISPALLRYIHSIIRNGPAAEDVLQEVLLLIYRKIRWLEDPASFRSWMYRLAGREAIRAALKGRRRPEIQLSDAEWNELEQYSGPSSSQKILDESARRAIEQLPPASRAVLHLHYLEDMEIHEAAALLGIPIGTAKSRLAFGLERLRRRIWPQNVKGRRENKHDV